MHVMRGSGVQEFEKASLSESTGEVVFPAARLGRPAKDIPSAGQPQGGSGTWMSQLRSRERLIWGALGEEALKGSSVLILGFSILTSELAVSLVSSGIANVVLVDDQVATEEDYGSCFGLDGERRDVVGRPKVHLLREYLSSLETGVAARVGCVLESPERYLETLRRASPDSPTAEHNVVVCCNVSGVVVEGLYDLAKRGRGISSPFVISLKSRGHLGQYQIHSVDPDFLTFDLSAEGKNLASLHGLQLCRPFESLKRASSEVELEKLEDGSEGLREYLSKVPFPLLLVGIGLRAGLFGSSGEREDEQSLRRKLLESMERVLKHHEYPNYCEARKYRHLLFSDPGELLGGQILGLQRRCETFGVQPCLEDVPFSLMSLKYRIVLGWIHKFLTDTNRFPVNSRLPEMHCDTLAYLQLQKLYEEQHSLDISRILDDSSSGLSRELVRFVCDHLYCLRLVEFGNPSFEWGELWDKSNDAAPVLGERLAEVFLADQDKRAELTEFLFLDFLDRVPVQGRGTGPSPETLLTEFRARLRSLGLGHIQTSPDLILR